VVGLKIERQDLMAKLKEMKKNGYDYLVKITAVDYEKNLDVVYFIRDLKEKNKNETIEVEIDPSDAWVPSVIGLYKAADWYEREIYEMFGIEIKNRYAERLLLEKWNGKLAPLRKNFAWGEEYEKSD
jgi:NADH-quinone oxidoreductase subunit C